MKIVSLLCDALFIYVIIVVMKYLSYLCISLVALFCISCSTAKNQKKELKSALPSAIVYKTTKDFSNLVPVQMDAERTHIVSYPAVSDIKARIGVVKPSKLRNGYLLDNVGITANVAYLDYTFEEYAALNETPSIEILMDHIFDKRPLLEMWNCGKRYDYESLSDLNKVIKKSFKDCVRVY